MCVCGGGGPSRENWGESKIQQGQDGIGIGIALDVWASGAGEKNEWGRWKLEPELK